MDNRCEEHTPFSSLFCSEWRELFLFLVAGGLTPFMTWAANSAVKHGTT